MTNLPTYLPTLYQDLATVVGGMADTGVPRPSFVRLRRDPGNSVNLRWLLLKRVLRDKSPRLAYFLRDSSAPPRDLFETITCRAFVWYASVSVLLKMLYSAILLHVAAGVLLILGVRIVKGALSFISSLSRFLRRREKIEYFRACPTLTKIYNSRWTWNPTQRQLSPLEFANVLRNILF